MLLFTTLRYTLRYCAFRSGVMNWSWKLKPGLTNVSETTIALIVEHWIDLRSDKIFIGLAICQAVGKRLFKVGTMK